MILDFGCGRGDFACFLSKAGYKVHGVDISNAALDKARQAYPHLLFERIGEMGQIPVMDAVYDVVWESEVLEHIFDVHAHLSEINRVLKSGGLFILTTPFHGRMKNIAIALTNFDRHFDPEKSHIRFFDRSGLKRCLVRAGFTPVRWSGIGRVWPVYKAWFVVAIKTGHAGMPPDITG